MSSPYPGFEPHDPRCFVEKESSGLIDKHDLPQDRSKDQGEELAEINLVKKKPIFINTSLTRIKEGAFSSSERTQGDLRMDLFPDARFRSQADYV